MTNFEIRRAAEGDAPLLLAFIKELAEYERLAHAVTATEEILRESLFGRERAAEALIGYYEYEPVAFAIFFHNFSTFVGRRGLYLEDLFVRPAYRGRGFGRAMLAHLAKLAIERNCGRFEWAVLDWNESAIRFYKNLGAVPLDDWTTFRLTGDALKRLAEGSE
jgi:GNAT superfamily N-acetyltransferase